MLELNRKNDEVYFGDKKLTIIKQEKKGKDKEVVKIEGLEGSNGQKYISLIKLKQGKNKIECQGREVSQGYYTKEEKEELEKLYDRINEIKTLAKKRQPQKLKTQKDIEKMDRKSLESYMGFLQGILDKKVSLSK